MAPTLWERVKRKTLTKFGAKRSFKSLTKPFYEMEEARRSHKVSSLVNVDDFEVTQRVGHVAFSHRGKIWVWGGYMQPPLRGDQQSHERERCRYWRTNWLFGLNSVSRKWVPIYTHPEDCPPPTSSGVVSVHGDTLYVFCGFILEGHTEQAVPESELGDRLSGSEKGVIDLLTIEDRHNYAASDVNSVFALDFTTRKWRQVEPTGGRPPFPCDKLSSVEYAGKSYLFGGYGPEPDQDHRLSAPKAVRWIVDGSTYEWSPRGWTNQLVEFDPGAAGSGGGPTSRGGPSWRWCSPTGVWPSPRAAHAMATDSEGGYAILFGGRFGPERLNDLFMLTFNSEGSGEMEWSLLLPSTDDLTAQTLNVPIGRSWHTFTSLSNNNFLLYGGYSTDDRPLSDCWVFSFNPVDHNRSRWIRMRHFEDPIDGVRFWHAAVRDESEDSVLVIGGYSTHTNVSDPETKHPDVILRLDLTPPTLFTLALDASCQVMENRKFTSQVPRTVAQAINDRMPKFIYERARKMVDDKHGGTVSNYRINALTHYGLG